MARIRGDRLGPEERLRAALRRLGVPHRRNVRELPGSPDIVVSEEPDLGLAVFVHGCFWHGHRPCYRAPRSRRAFWRRKLADNRRRDRRARRALHRAGWRVAVVWECALRSGAAIAERLKERLAEPREIGTRGERAVQFRLRRPTRHGRL